MNVSLIVTAFNEGNHLIDTLKKVPEEFREIIIVDDGSLDDTFSLGRKFSKKNSRVKIYKNKTNMGKGYSMRKGALKSKYSKLVFMDASNFDPKDALRIARKISKDKMILGCRHYERMPLHRQINNFLTKLALYFATFKWVEDPLSGFRGITKEDFKNLETKENRYAIEAEICYRAVRNNLKIENVNVNVEYDGKPSSIMNFRSNFEIIWFLVKAVFRVV